MENEVINAGTKEIPNPDYIFNLFDLTPVFISKKLLETLEYKNDQPKSVKDVLVAKKDTFWKVATDTFNDKNLKKSVLTLKTAKGNLVEAYLLYKGFNIGEVPYEVGKVVKTKVKKE